MNSLILWKPVWQISLAFVVLSNATTTYAGILWSAEYGEVSGPNRSWPDSVLTGVPTGITYQIDEVNRHGINPFSGNSFTYSLKTGVYQSVGSHSAALIVPDGLFELESQGPLSALVSMSAFADGRLIGKDLITAAGFRIWGNIAPGDEVYYSFSGGTRNYAGYGEEGRGASFWGNLVDPGYFDVSRTYISDVYGTGPFGIDLKKSLSFVLQIKRGSSGEKTTIYIDPGVGTYELGTTPDFPFLNSVQSVPEPGSALVFLFCGASSLFLHKGMRIRRS